MEQKLDAHVLKTGTTTVGIVCKDGVVMAADMRMTAGNFIAGKTTEKVFPIDDNMAVTIAGVVSDIQLNAKVIKAELKLKKLRTLRENKVKEAANLIAGMSYAALRSTYAIMGFLVGGRDVDGYHLYDIGPDGSIKQIEEFTTDGSGGMFALSVLESDYKKGISVKEGAELAVKALEIAQRRDNASGDGFNVLTITEKGIEKVITKRAKVTFE